MPQERQSLIRWAFCIAAFGLIVVAFVVGGYVLGPLVIKDKPHTQDPSVYEYYTAGGITEGLKAGTVDFTLNKKVISLHSGSIHYFRVHPQYWRDRLRKLRAAGFVAVETYVPWNLHEPYDGVFDFGNGGEDMSPFLDIRTFLKIAQEEDLLAILRPGPYICAEWEFGGLPSWLQKIPSIKVRTSDPKYTERVQRFFDVLLPILKNLQFSTGQGPIIAFQVENEYGNTKEPNKDTDKQHLRDIKAMFEKAGLAELFFTSDTPSKGREYGAIEGVLEVANFNENPTGELNLLKELQPNKAAMVMEFWTGWFDHWGEAHHGMTLDNFKKVLEDILKYPSGVNFYMFHGGTSFGFLNGGNVYKEFPFYLPDISSYDYDAPLSEAGDYTEKYEATVSLLAKYQKVTFRKPERPVETPKKVYTPLSSPDFLNWNSLLDQVDAEDKQDSPQPIYMEYHQANGGSGQNFGYIVYRKKDQSLTPTSTLKIDGKINGAAMVMVNNELKSPPLQTVDDLKGFGYWCSDSDKNTLDLKLSSATTAVLDIIIENWSRNNYGKLSTDFNQVRGLTSNQVYVDGNQVQDFTIYALQFKGKWVRRLKNWTQNQVAGNGPVMLKFKLNVEQPTDTFLDMQGWGKGVVFVNGFNIGRYSTIGPLRTLFAPAPLFQSGTNEICVFEHFKPSSELKFSDRMIYKDSEKTINVDL
ncbi:beta-galactosidase-1-like protein 2 isoform X2 [Thrips palmi]|uniref:Beta-galactosidase-1-like protein 2 isoform X2 n=1 Tax=Thrips palmi TaxID=161013 RepID=A0A6P8YHM8_THRPL|nr:beta-galactosidase-1-like protein 2 isoform X2 [Thrips palmi]